MNVYISSTYEDLQTERRIVRDAVSDLHHVPIGMETYEASDQRPLERCLEDVRACQAYVGIFAWKYGFCPNGGATSITELEYLEAAKHSIPCFIYLLGETVPWRRDWMPKEDQDRIEALRNRLKTERLVKFFANPTDLGHAVTQSLSRHVSPALAARPIPAILPYLCDRSAQEEKLTDIVDHSTSRPSRPLVCIIHGDETEAHDKFLERLQTVTLPSVLSGRVQQTGVKLYRLEWPADRLAPGEIKRRLQRSLSREVFNSPNANIDLLNNILRQNPGPVSIHSHILTETWEEQNLATIDSFLQFWQEWPELAVGQQLIGFLFIKYQLGGRKYRAANKEIREALESYDLSRFDQVTAGILPELIGASRLEAENWARSSAATQFCDAEALVSAVGKFYEDWAAVKKSREMVRIPMEHLAPKLKELMSRVQYASGGIQ
ncbi:MAG TPA: DUF4062 domain-containing protein [Bryobacteraceae bacterium]|nr:DUF4062 domain-containing protein [Bryobacteraceae bacterium]